MIHYHSLIKNNFHNSKMKFAEKEEYPANNIQNHSITDYNLNLNENQDMNIFSLNLIDHPNFTAFDNPPQFDLTKQWISHNLESSSICENKNKNQCQENPPFHSSQQDLEYKDVLESKKKINQILDLKFNPLISSKNENNDKMLQERDSILYANQANKNEVIFENINENNSENCRAVECLNKLEQTFLREQNQINKTEVKQRKETYTEQKLKLKQKHSKAKKFETQIQERKKNYETNYKKSFARVLTLLKG